MSEWFSVTSLGDGISLILENHVASDIRCNIWHIRGRKLDLLIDSGMGLTPLKPTISKLAEHPVTAISSHAHFDHIGGAHEFDVHLGHRADEAIYNNPTRENTLAADFVNAEIVTHSPSADFSIEEYQVKPAPLTGHLDEGDVIDLGNRVFHVLHLPGHTPGAISLYDPASQTLFSGDVVYDGGLIDNAYHSNTEDYEASLRRLKELPVSVVHGGHDASFGQERMSEIIDNFLAGGQRWPFVKVDAS